MENKENTESDEFLPPPTTLSPDLKDNLSSISIKKISSPISQDFDLSKNKNE
jgi:hypothetical protein